MVTPGFKVASSGRGRRIVVVAPGGRADVARPRYHVAPGRIAKTVSCAIDAPRVRYTSPWLVLKLAVLGALAVLGFTVSAPGLAALLSPPLEPGYVAGDPAWAHVEQP